MIRTLRAYFRASRALSPAGTRKTLIPARSTPIVFCFTPPISPTRPSSSIAPVTATLLPWSTSFPISSSTSSANARPADGSGVDLHGERKLDRGRLRDDHADDRPAVGPALGTHRGLERLRAALHSQPQIPRSPRGGDRRAEPAGAVDRLAVDGRDHVARVELPAGRRLRVGELDARTDRRRD